MVFAAATVSADGALAGDRMPPCTHPVGERIHADVARRNDDDDAGA